MKNKSMPGSVPNVKKAQRIHEKRQAARNTKVSAMKRGTVGTNLQGMVNKAYGK